MMTTTTTMAFCQPPKGQTYLTIGQDLFSVQDYLQVQYNYSLHAYIIQQQEQQEKKKMTNQTQQQRQQHQHQHHYVDIPRPPLPTASESLPAAFMMYTDIQTLKGLDIPTDYGSGVEYANGLASLYSYSSGDMDPTTATTTTTTRRGKQEQEQQQQRQHGGTGAGAGGGGLQIGLWLNGTSGCRDIISGALDANIQKLLQYIVTKNSFEQVFLRVGYEFDNPSFGYSSSSSSSDDDHDTDDHDDHDGDDDPIVFQQAFRYIVQACRDHDDQQQRKQQQQRRRKHLQTNQSRQTHHHQRGSQQHPLSFCMTKTVFVWHSWAASLTTSDQLARYYPGNDHVDWIGISLFSQLYKNTTHPFKLGSIETVQAVLNFARDVGNDKPVMIAESTPFGGIPSLTDPWQDWFVPVLQLIHNESNNIAMWSYIHCDWNSQPMWHNVGFGDSRLSVNQTVLQQWQQAVMQSKRFLQHGSLSRYCNTRRRRARAGGAGRHPAHAAPGQHYNNNNNNSTIPVATRSSSNIAMTLDDVTTARLFTTDKTWYAPAAISRLDIEVVWMAGLGIGLFVMILGMCQYYWRTSSMSRRNSTQTVDDDVNRCINQMLTDADSVNVFEAERQTLIESNRTGYGSLK